MNFNAVTQSFVTDLFDASKPGLQVLPMKLGEGKLDEMNAFIRANTSAFEVKREKYIENNQLVSLLYRGPFDTSSLDNTIFSEIVESYKQLRDQISALSDIPFSQGSSIEIKLIHYPVSKLGVGIHKDLSSNLNLIVFFNLFGSTNVMTYDDKAGNGSVAHPVRAGDISVMRGPRNVDEPDIRPYHAVGEIFEPRTVMVIREIDEELEKFTNADNWRGF
jgi:hypothetical protein